MFQATDTAWAPWFIARSDNKRQARLNIIAHLLSRIPFKKVRLFGSAGHGWPP
jgi:polyphosphate kinase 2 (PPK2 family)